MRSILRIVFWTVIFGMLGMLGVTIDNGIAPTSVLIVDSSLLIKFLLVFIPFLMAIALVATTRNAQRPVRPDDVDERLRVAERRLQDMLTKLDLMTHEAEFLLKDLNEGKAILVRTDRPAYALPEIWEIEDTEAADRDPLMKFVYDHQPGDERDGENWRRDLKRALAAEKAKMTETTHA